MKLRSANRLISRFFSRFNMQTIIQNALKASLLLLLPYIISMVFYPLYQGGYSNLHMVWREWQTLNAGVIAYFAAALIYYAGKLDSDRHLKAQRAIDRALLSRGLLAVHDYCDECISYFMPVVNEFKLPERELPDVDDIIYDTLSASIASSKSEISSVLYFMLQDIELIRRRSSTAQSLARSHLRVKPPLNTSHINYIYSLVCIALSVRKSSSSLLSYARGISSDVSNIDDDEVLFLAISNPSDIAKVKEYLSANKKSLDSFVKQFADVRLENPIEH